MDLAGTTFWEFKDPLNPVRSRRMAEQSRRKHYADMQISPAWHQWLRHTRFDAPSIEEQQADMQRQFQLKQLAQLADERWASKASYLDSPKDTGQTAPATAPKDSGGYKGKMEHTEARNQRSKRAKSPYKASGGGPSEKWQPASWEPGVTKR